MCAGFTHADTFIHLPTSPSPPIVRVMHNPPSTNYARSRDNKRSSCGTQVTLRSMQYIMKNRPSICYLRTHRRVWGLTQAEIADLLGLRSASAVSCLERSKRKRGPTYETALACQVLFGIEPRDMYPTIHRQVEERVIRACYRMHQGMENTTSLSDLRKRELLELALRRAINRDRLTTAV